MNERKYQWPIYETWIVTSKPSRSFNFILGYKEVVFTLGFLRQNAHCYAKKCYASGKQLTPVLFRKHGRVYILMARTKQRLAAKQKAELPLPFEGDHLHPKIKIKSELPQVNHTGSVHISLVPRRSLLPRCPRKVWERAGERGWVSFGDVDNVQDWTSQRLADSAWNIAVVIN